MRKKIYIIIGVIVILAVFLGIYLFYSFDRTLDGSDRMAPSNYYQRTHQR